MLLHTPGLPSEQYYFLTANARRLYHFTMADNVPTKPKHEAYYRSQPYANDRLDRFGDPVIIKVWPTLPGLQPHGPMMV